MKFLFIIILIQSCAMYESPYHVTKKKIEVSCISTEHKECSLLELDFK